MLDPEQKQALMEKLRNRIKKASSTVSMTVEANKGDFTVKISSNNIDQFYKNQKVGTIKVADLDDEMINLINADAKEAATEMVETLANSFDINDFEKQASTKKEAANDVIDSTTYQMTTEKQLEDKKPDLHPRTSESPAHITQKQIPNSGQRPGTYNEITEAQLAQEKTTFYNKPLEAGARKLEDRNIITEAQLEKGAKEYSEQGQSDRGEVSSKFDGDLAKQQSMINEKQIAELLSHHEWTQPHTITEGKDQLGQQKGELSRLTADIAQQIVKAAYNAMGNTVIAMAVTPAELTNIINRLVSHYSKYPVLESMITNYANANLEEVNQKIARAQYFGKVANTSDKNSSEKIAEIFIKQLGKIQHSAKHIVDGLVAMASMNNIVSEIDNAVKKILEQKPLEASSNENLSVFKQVLSSTDTVAETEQEEIIRTAEGTAENDGMYQYSGFVTEISEPTTSKEKFAKAASAHAKKLILAEVKQNIELEPIDIKVNEEQGRFKITFRDPNFQTNITSRAEKRRQRLKTAQMGGLGGGAPGGAPAMGNPAPPTGGADMAAPPPAESFSQEPPAIEDSEPMEGQTGEAQPPGTICPACGSQDVNIDNGEMRCNSCGGEGTIHVDLKMTKWPDTIQETEAAEEPGFGIGAEENQKLDTEGLGAEPASAGGGTTMPSVPVAASIRITPRMLEKIGQLKVPFGSICPNCGGHNTDKFKAANRKGDHAICWDCNQEYNFQVKVNPKKVHRAYAQFIWKPKTAESCSTCNRLSNSFAKSLNDYGMKMSEFEQATLSEKGQIILKMAQAGVLNHIYQTMKAPVSLNKYAATFKQKFDKFPSASCMERIARRFGENATAMSGPCQGKSLSKCVCSQLEGLGIYTDGLAAKVAHVLSSTDPMLHSPSETCVKMFLDENRTIKEACTICDGLRAAAATDEDLIIEAIAQVNPFSKLMPKPMNAPTGDSKPMCGSKPMCSPSGGSKPMSGSSGMQPSVPDMSPKPEIGVDDPMITEDNSNLEDNSNFDVSPHDDTSITMDIEGDLGGFDDLDSFDDSGLNEESDLVTIVVDGLQSIIDALQGNVTDDMLDNSDDVTVQNDVTAPEGGDNGTGDSLDDLGESETVEDSIGEVSDDNSNEIEEDISNESSDNIDDNNEEESDIPGVVDDKDDELVKESNPEEDDISITASKTNNKQVVASTEELDQMLYHMKKGTISKSATALDDLVARLTVKTAKEDSDGIKKTKTLDTKEDKLKTTPAQESSGIGKVKDGGKIGHEKSFTDGVKNKPDVPRGKATIGDEDDNVNDEDRPSVPHGSKAMEGEEHFKPEKGNEVDGNQGGKKASTKTINKTASCKCGSDNKCKCDSGDCAKCCPCKSASIKDKTKTAQSVKPKSVKNLENDPDLNNSSGPGKGKTHVDQAHSLAVDEKKPSEGMKEADIPKAPNGGRLQRELSVEVPTDGPEVPAGGGRHPEYDENDKNEPEKMDQTLGKEQLYAAKHERAIKIAGRMLKSNMIDIKELPNKINELSKASSAILDDFEKMIKEANTKKGLQKTAETAAVETSFQLHTTPHKGDSKTGGNEIVESIQNLMRLNKVNKDYERLTGRS